MILRSLFLLVFIFFISDFSFSQELPVNDEGALRAFPAPEFEDVQKAVWSLIGIFALVLIFILSLAWFWILYCKSDTSIQSPKEYKRGKNYRPYEKPVKEETTKVYEIFDD